METVFTRLLGVDLPIVQAPIGGHQRRPPVAEIVRSIAADAQSILRDLGR